MAYLIFQFIKKLIEILTCQCENKGIRKKKFVCPPTSVLLSGRIVLSESVQKSLRGTSSQLISPLNIFFKKKSHDHVFFVILSEYLVELLLAKARLNARTFGKHFQLTNVPSLHFSSQKTRIYVYAYGQEQEQVYSMTK